MRPVDFEWRKCRKFKLRIRKRDKICRICGSSQYLRCCHIYPKGKYRHLMKDPNNVILLCWVCDYDFGNRLMDYEVKKLYRR